MPGLNPKRNKYGSQRSGGYDSRKEHRRALELQIMQRAGLISGLREQVTYELIPPQYGQPDVAHNNKRHLIERACRYIADFVYTDTSTGELVVEDCKGVRTDAYRIKRKLMLWVHNVVIKET